MKKKKNPFIKNTKQLFESKHLPVFRERVDSIVISLEDEENSLSQKLKDKSIVGLVLESTQENHRKVKKDIKKWNTILASMDAGTFGYCQSTGKAISLARLYAYPDTRYCLGTQTLEDAEKKAASERPDSTVDRGSATKISIIGPAVARSNSQLNYR